MDKQVMETLEECKDIFEAIPAIAPTHIELISQCIETNEKVKQAIAQLEGQGWQPIESAPRDGTSFDIWVKSTKNPYYGVRLTNTYFIGDVIYGLRYPQACFGEYASHWRPLPPAPDAAMEEQKHG